MVALLVLTMAIGIAACMTAMTVFGALAGEPLPGVSNHLYVVTMDARGADARDTTPYTAPDSLLTLRDAKALVNAHRAAQQIALAKSLTTFHSADGKHADQAFGLMGYGPLLATLGVPLSHGRPWTHAELAAHDPVVIIDTDLSEKLFGTDDAVGRSVKLGSRLFRVIGITPSWKPRVRFLGAMHESNALPSNINFLVPAQAALDAGVGPFMSGECPKKSAFMSFQSTNVERCRWLEVWVALDTPAQVASYRKYVADYAHTQHAAGRFVNAPHAKLYRTRTWMDLNGVVPNDVSLNVMLAGAFLVLCMVNVAGLLAARFLRRSSSVAIRRALGASRRHVFAQHLVEAGMLGLAGGLLALPLTLLGLWIVRMQPVGYAAAAQFSIGVFGALVVLSVVVGLLVGVLPAWRACTQPPAIQIKVA
jgi:putative ABC transport system permease protein